MTTAALRALERCKDQYGAGCAEAKLVLLVRIGAQKTQRLVQAP